MPRRWLLPWLRSLSLPPGRLRTGGALLRPRLLPLRLLRPSALNSGRKYVCVITFRYMYKILYFSLFLQHILTMYKTLLNLHSLLTPDANTARPFSHANGTTFRRTNCQLRLKRSGMPSRLSLRRQWIPSLLKAFPTVCFGRGGGLYLLFGIRLLHHN